MGDDLERAPELERLRARDPDAWRRLLGPLRPRLQAALCHLLSPSDVEDITQETLLNVYRQVEGFRGSASFTTWVVAAAKKNAYKLLRDRQTRARLARTFPSESPPAMGEPSLTPETLVSGFESLRKAMDAIERLPSAKRSLLLESDDAEGAASTRVARHRVRSELKALLGKGGE